jgi:hypothetical protein
MRFQNRLPLGKRASCTLVRERHGMVLRRERPRAVAECQVPTSPRMRIRHFNIACVAWSNFKTGFNVNGRIAISNYFTCIDVVSMSAGIEEAFVALMGVGWGGAKRLSVQVALGSSEVVQTRCLSAVSRPKAQMLFRTRMSHPLHALTLPAASCWTSGLLQRCLPDQIMRLQNRISL